jgi:2-dehydropantoate 2-reductase
MKFAIIGAGGVGGYFGGKLAVSGKDVWFVVRGKHLAAMKANGLCVNSSEGQFTVPPGKMTDNPAEIGPVDVVLFCVKSYDTGPAAQQLAPILAERTLVISLQNGVDNEEQIQRIIPAGTVYGGAAYIYSTVTAPGVITETGGPKKIVFGAMPGANNTTRETAKGILDSLIEAGIKAELTDDISSALWNKFILITSVGGLTALTRLTLGEILAVDESRALLTDAMREVETIAKAKGMNIEAGYVDRVIRTLRRFGNSNHSSLYYDLVHEKPMEIEALSGAVVKYGQSLGIPTPIHKTIYGALLPYHLKHLGAKQ